jgi:choice-of-anchor B domain-containing protein
LLPLNLIGQEQLKVVGRWTADSLPVTGGGATFNECWGFKVNGAEYAVIGSTRGAHIIALDGEEPEQLFRIDGERNGPQHIHRDYDQYKNYLYTVADQGFSSLQIIDISGLPDKIEVVYDSTYPIVNAHNIFIDTVSGHLYSCLGGLNVGGNRVSNKISVFDLNKNPERPELLIRDTEIPWWTFGGVHDVYVRNDTAYLNAQFDGLVVADFTDMSSPKLLGRLDLYPERGYNHSGWLHESGDWYAMADETHGTRIKIVDVRDFGNMQVHSLFGSEVNYWSIVHNLLFKGDSLYVSYYADGAYVFDLTDMANPEVAAFYDTNELFPDSVRYDGVWGIYPFLPSERIIASDRQNGMFLFELPRPVAAFNFFSIRGNHFNRQLHINVDGPEGREYKFSMLNAMGQEVGSASLNVGNNRIDLSSIFADGLYFVHLSDGVQSQIFKVFKGEWSTY